MRRLRVWVACTPLLTVAACAPATQPAPSPPAPPASAALSPAGMRIETMQINGERFSLEMAETTATRTRGLGGRSAVPPHTGMLFRFPYAAELRFWMKDCLVPVDVAFVDERGMVLSVYEMPIEAPRGAQETESAYDARLPGYTSLGAARFALELGAGEMKRLGVRPGVRLTLPASPTVQPAG